MMIFIGSFVTSMVVSFTFFRFILQHNKEAIGFFSWKMKVRRTLKKR